MTAVRPAQRLLPAAAVCAAPLVRAAWPWLAGAVAAGLGQVVALIAQAAVLSGLLAGALYAPPTTRAAAYASVAVLILAAAQGVSGWAWETCTEGAARRARAAARREAVARAVPLAASSSGRLDETGLRVTGPYQTRPPDAGPPREPADPGPGAVNVLLGSGIDDLDPFVGRVLPRAALAVLAPALLLAWIAHLDLLSAAIAALVLLLSPVLAALAGAGTAPAVRRRLASLERLGDRFTALIEGLPVLRAYGRARDHERAVAASGEEVRAASLATIRLALLAGLVLELLAAVGTALVAVPLGLRLDAGHRMLPEALAVLMLTPELFLPLRRLIADFHAGTSGRAALARLGELTGEPGTHLRLEGAPVAAAPAGQRGAMAAGIPAGIVIDAVSVAVPGRARPVLDRVALRVTPRERVCVTGASGAGKSTLLRVAAGLVPPSAGTARIEASGTPPGWRPALGWVPQHPTVLDGTVLDNVTLGRAGAGPAEACAALEAAQLGPWLAAQPRGLHTRLTGLDTRLSLGELRRLAVARVLAGSPPGLWLLDEPTAGLDADSAERLIGVLAAATRGATALIASHDPAVLALATRVIEMRHGRIHCQRTGAQPRQAAVAALGS